MADNTRTALLSVCPEGRKGRTDPSTVAPHRQQADGGSRLEASLKEYLLLEKVRALLGSVWCMLW